MTLSLIGNIGTGTQWRSWLRHCATTWKIVGSIPRVVMGIFHVNNPADRTMDLGSTQPLTEVSTRTISCTGIAGGRMIVVKDLEGSVCDVSDIQSSQILRGTEESAKTYIRTGHLLNALRSHTTWLNTFGSQESQSVLNEYQTTFFFEKYTVLLWNEAGTALGVCF